MQNEQPNYMSLFEEEESKKVTYVEPSMKEPERTNQMQSITQIDSCQQVGLPVSLAVAPAHPEVAECD